MTAVCEWPFMLFPDTTHVRSPEGARAFFTGEKPAPSHEQKSENRCKSKCSIFTTVGADCLNDGREDGQNDNDANDNMNMSMDIRHSRTDQAAR